MAGSLAVFAACCSCGLRFVLVTFWVKCLVMNVRWCPDNLGLWLTYGEFATAPGKGSNSGFWTTRCRAQACAFWTLHFWNTCFPFCRSICLPSLHPVKGCVLVLQTALVSAFQVLTKPCSLQQHPPNSFFQSWYQHWVYLHLNFNVNLYSKCNLASLCSHGDCKKHSTIMFCKRIVAFFHHTQIDLSSTSKIQQYSFDFKSKLSCLCSNFIMQDYGGFFFLASHFGYFLQWLICKFRNEPKDNVFACCYTQFNPTGYHPKYRRCMVAAKSFICLGNSYSFQRCLGMHPDQQAGDQAGRCCFWCQIICRIHVAGCRRKLSVFYTIDLKCYATGFLTYLQGERERETERGWGTVAY